MFLALHNEHDAFAIIPFCAVTVQAIKKWEMLQNVCDVVHSSNKIFIATEMQTGSERMSDKKNRLNYARTWYKVPLALFLSGSLEVSDRILCSLIFGGVHQILTYVTELHSISHVRELKQSYYNAHRVRFITVLSVNILQPNGRVDQNV
jgi:hypothetical protein